MYHLKNILFRYYKWYFNTTWIFSKSNMSKYLYFYLSLSLM